MMVRDNFKKLCEPIIKGWLNELIKGTGISEASKFNEKFSGTKYEMYPESLPMIFTGNLESDVVFIELNPGYGLLTPSVNNNELLMQNFKNQKTPVVKDFSSYVSFFSQFGTCKSLHLQRDGNKKLDTHGKRQIDFFFGLGLLDNYDYSFENYEFIRNDKLQLEFIPYMSKSFSFSKFSNSEIEKRFDFIKEIVSLKERKYVIVTGNKKLLEQLFKSEKVKFEPHIIEGRKKADIYSEIIIENEVKYILAPSYKSQSLHSNQLRNYGQQIKEKL